VREPADQSYGVREYSARDLEGQEWFFSTPLASAIPAAKKRAMKPRVARAAGKAKKSAARKK